MQGWGLEIDFWCSHGTLGRKLTHQGEILLEASGRVLDGQQQVCRPTQETLWALNRKRGYICLFPSCEVGALPQHICRTNSLHF